MDNKKKYFDSANDVLKQIHLVNDDMMKISKLPSLINSLKESWDCDHDDVQVQVRFVPEGTDREEQ